MLADVKNSFIEPGLIERFQYVVGGFSCHLKKTLPEGATGWQDSDALVSQLLSNFNF